MRKKNMSSGPQRGAVLIVVLWILTILILLAIGLGRKASLELTLTKYSLGKLRSKYIAMAGVTHALEQIRLDKPSNPLEMFDTKYACGFLLKDGQTPRDLFGKQPVDDGHFDIYFFHPADGTGTVYYGFEDEESKINLNTITINESDVLKNLILVLGYDEETADVITASVFDWRDEDAEVTQDTFGAENEFYAKGDFPYACKNQPFDSIDELRSVRGVTEEIYHKIKNYVSVFPRTGRLLVNMDTSSEEVLRALAQQFSGDRTNTTVADAESLVRKIIDHRAGEDRQFLTEDDRPVDLKGLELNAKERVLFLLISRYHAKTSNFIRFKVRGVDRSSAVSSFIEAVVDRRDLSFVYFKRD